MMEHRAFSTAKHRLMVAGKLLQVEPYQVYSQDRASAPVHKVSFHKPTISAEAMGKTDRMDTGYPFPFLAPYQNLDHTFQSPLP
ncbi:MAG: hypothetical protein QME54_05785 [Actinomycetota bacterium]|nr:hypothetical protein [Actinomycetota bacterium]